MPHNNINNTADNTAYDMLNHWMSLAQISGCIHTQCHLQGGWQLAPDFQKRHRGVFHLLRKGECQIITDNQDCYHLTAGDFLYFPKGGQHYLSANLPSDSNNINQYQLPTERINSQQRGAFQIKTQIKTVENTNKEDDQAEIELFCGYFDYAPNSLLIEELPDVMQVSIKSGRLEQLGELIYAEMDNNLPAQKTAIDSLCNYLFVVVLRRFLAKNTGFSPLLTLKDEPIIKLITAIIENPADKWTLDNMAQYCYLSRSVFSKRFHEQVGYTPNRFLTQIRLDTAMVLLKTTNRTLLDIAIEVGFQSESYFGKLFKERLQMTPNDYRQMS